MHRLRLVVHPVDAVDAGNVLDRAEGRALREVADDAELLPFGEGEDGAEPGELAGVVAAVLGVEGHGPAEHALLALVERRLARPLALVVALVGPGVLAAVAPR